jgi:glucose-6-phosphate isomerase
LAAAGVLDLQHAVVNALAQSDQPLSLSELAAQAGAPDQVETIYAIARHLHANQRNLVIHGNPGHPEAIKISAL